MYLCIASIETGIEWLVFADNDYTSIAQHGNLHLCVMHL